MNLTKFMALVIEAETNLKKSWADYSETEGLPLLPSSWRSPNKSSKKRGINSVPLGIKRA
jgi:hypothetical protein